MTITVTKEDIAAGVREDCYACPIALALARTFPGTRWDVEDGTWLLERNANVRYAADDPEVVDAFIELFDINGDPLPFSFDIHVVEDDDDDDCDSSDDDAYHAGV